MYEGGTGVDRDYEEALNWYHRAADQKHPEAQFKLGVIYANGLGVEKNVDRALAWLLASAVQGHLKAGSIFDSLAISGDLKSNTNLVEVFKWYQKAADQDQPEAQFKLGMMYYKGNGVPQDLSKAAHWFEKAAVQGDAYAQFNFGLMCEKGEGVAKDLSKAADWYKKAAAQGYADAQVHVGRSYER